MRRFSFFDGAALLAAAGVGFLTGERIHRQDPVTIQVCDSSGELSDAPPVALAAPQLIEDIDLTCLPSRSPMLYTQTAEPPLADDPAIAIRTVNFELPAGAPISSDLFATMPYLTDDPSPGLLPALGDVPLLPPVPAPPSGPMPDPSNPIYQAVKTFVNNAAKMPEVTDKVPLGKPPVSEHPSAAPPNKP